MSDEWNEAQGRINDAGANFEHLAHNQPPTMEGYALLAMVDVVRQVGIEMLATDHVTYEMEETAGELSAETLYHGGDEEEPVTGRVTGEVPLPLEGFEPIEHYCESQRMVIPGARSKCGWEH